MGNCKLIFFIFFKKKSLLKNVFFFRDGHYVCLLYGTNVNFFSCIYLINFFRK
ncbi:hypothetical protein LbFV_ORF47 [Leptopilina boulardi filamentous virus]|uniref:Uncharacterized protein n=1 Tax=Leptopilina boulardi filamentous virus TaxID=552509 RepID=A0A1S5YD87_9VIRU|nr:hypothetical protein LbFV_ORF46 [Leptopilina boulardi filamentous virus]YP_009345651.1 hypothetical protein LbFV_ORF47 [Leptopilina boulardi filamentous virus]AQQ79966.1 hypothetical protein LbFV_ORF46 [Leptopilina boulardi filamentous virus]AQQ79967.1 hypothetical protein LbFV_ORF47 [Leptopilina boulardi filamentous virus]